jgi:hypothetical protein
LRREIESAYHADLENSRNREMEEEARWSGFTPGNAPAIGKPETIVQSVPLTSLLPAEVTRPSRPEMTGAPQQQESSFEIRPKVGRVPPPPQPAQFDSEALPFRLPILGRQAPKIEWPTPHPRGMSQEASLGTSTEVGPAQPSRPKANIAKVSPVPSAERPQGAIDPNGPAWELTDLDEKSWIDDPDAAMPFLPKVEVEGEDFERSTQYRTGAPGFHSVVRIKDPNVSELSAADALLSSVFDEPEERIRFLAGRLYPHEKRDQPMRRFEWQKGVLYHPANNGRLYRVVAPDQAIDSWSQGEDTFRSLGMAAGGIVGTIAGGQTVAGSTVGGGGGEALRQFIRGLLPQHPDYDVWDVVKAAAKSGIYGALFKLFPQPKGLPPV